MEPDKKFKNLSSTYRKYLDEVEKLLASYDTKKVYEFNDLNNYLMKIILKSLKGELTHIEVEPNQTVLYLNNINYLLNII